MKSGAATPTPLSGPLGGYLPKTDSYMPSTPLGGGGGGGSGAPDKPKRPFSEMGKSSLSVYGPAGYYAFDPDSGQRDQSLIQGEAFKGVPVLEQASQVIGGVANIPGYVLSIPERFKAARVWEENAGTRERAYWEALVNNNAVSQEVAEAQFRRQLFEEQHKGDKGLFKGLFAPSGDYSLGGQLMYGMSNVFALPQRPWIRATGGNVGGLIGSLSRGDFRSPAEQRLDSFRTATDAQLNYGAGETGHPELIDIRNRLNAGKITPDEAFDELIVAGFGVSNPVDLLPSIFNELGSDPTNLLGLGAGTVAVMGTRAATNGAKAFAKELGEQGLKQFVGDLSKRGIVASEHNLISHALKDPAMLAVAEKALKSNANKFTRFMLLDAPYITRVGHAVNEALGPLSLFGRDSVGKATAEQFSRKLGSGTINGFGASNYRAVVANASHDLGDDVAEIMQDGFDRGAMQIGLQVGNEQNIRHIRVTQSLDGIGNDATAAAMGSAARLGHDIARRAQDRVERIRYRIVPTVRGAEGVAAAVRDARERAINQVLSMARGKVDRSAAETFVGKLSEDQLSLLDFMHYGKVTEDFIAARNSAVAEGAFDLAERTTFIGPRQLTRPALDDLKKALNKGQVATVRGMIEKYDDLYRIYDLELSDIELMSQLRETYDQLVEHAPQVLTDVSGLPVALQEFLRKYESMGYHVGLSPDADTLARPLMDKQGRIVGVNPWVDLVDGKTARASIGRLQVMQRGLFNNISGSSVIREAEHRFVRLGAERFGAPEQPLRGLFAEIMREASKTRTTVRGLHPHEMYQIAIDSRMPKRLRARMTERDLAELVLEAHEGSLSKVGVTQKFTGKMKTNAIVYGGTNALGVLAERLYPTLRFTLNPFFQLQEMIETPFFMILRGRVPMADFRRVWTSEGRKELNDEIDKTLWVMGLVERKGSFYAQDMMEMSMLTLHGNRAVNATVRRNGVLERFGKAIPNVARMKEWGVARSFQHEQAKALSSAMKTASPESWENFARWLAYRSGQKSDLDAVTNYVYDTVAKADPDSAYAQFGYQALKPAHLGAQQKISTSLLRGLLYGEEEGKAVKWKTLLDDIAKGAKSATDVSEALTRMGADPIYIQRAVDLVTMPRPEDFYKAFIRLGRSEDEVAAIRQSAQALARLRGVSEHEQIASMYAAAPRALNHLGETQSRKLFQAIADSFIARGMRVPEASDPALDRLATVGEKHLPELPPAEPGVPVKNLTKAQQKRRSYEVATQRMLEDPTGTVGRPPSMTSEARGVTPEQGAAIQKAYDEGNPELGAQLQREAMAGEGAIPGFGAPPKEGAFPPRYVTATRNGATIHRLGPVEGDQWWDMLHANMDQDTLVEKADWYVDMRRGFLALADGDEEEAARLIVLFGISQLNTSPVDGMKFIHRALAAHKRGLPLPIDQQFSGLNSAAVKQLLEETQLTEAGLGQKLLDFVDSLLGRKTRTAGPVGPDPMNPWMPVAGDIWAKRDLGFIDPKMSTHLGRVYGGKAVWDEKIGFTVTTREGDTFVIPREKVTGVAPSDTEYAYIVQFYNDRAREANQRNFLGRQNWSAAEMQALGWFRAKFAMGDRTGSPLDAFHKNVHSIHWEAAPSPGSRFRDVFPGQERMFEKSVEGFNRGRLADPGEIAALKTEGEQIMRDLEQAPSVPRTEFDAEAVRAQAFATVQDEWGGASFDSHTGKLLKSEAVYHGTMGAFTKSIERTGVQRGDFVNDVKLAKQYARGGAVYRTRPALGQGGVEKAPGWFEGMRVRPENLEVLRDLEHGSFEPLVPGSKVGEGPFTTSLGDTTGIPIEQASDEAAFNLAFDQFVAANAAELDKEGRYVGVFRNQDTGQIEFDVSVTVPTKREAEALQLAAGREGGAYDHWTGNGVFAPVVGQPEAGLPEDVLKAITKDVAAYVQQEAQSLVGVQVVARFDGVGAWRGGLNPNAAFEVLGTPEDAQAFARVVAYLSQQEGVPVSRLASRTMKAKAAEGRFHSVDWTRDGKGLTYAEAEDALRRLDRESPLVHSGGGSIVRYDDGTYGVRAIWRDSDSVAAFRKAVPDDALKDSGGLTGERGVVESSYHENNYDQFPNGEGHLNWLRENGYASVADKLAGSGRDRAALYYERAYRKHYAHGLDQWRNDRALTDDQWAERAGPLLDDLDVAYGRSVALDPTAGPDLLGRAADAAARGDALFQRYPRGTLGAIAFDGDTNRARIYLNAKTTRADTLLHEESHRFAEQALDPSGRAAILDAYNLDVGRRAARRRPVNGQAGVPARATTWTEDVHEWFAKQYIEWVRTGESPARHLDPIFGYYSKYLTTTTAKAKMAPEVKAILDEVTSRKVARVSAANEDEVALMNIMIGEADRSARNARDLIHFRTNRSWLERSVNHPYFGMYPLSYMWGKVLPELVEFLMFRPFGVPAPMVAYNTVGDIYRGVMLQQENDPELRTYLKDNEPTMRALAMLVPGVPWDLPVNSPLWLRRISEAVATQNKRVLEGATNPDGTPAAIDLGKIDAPKIIGEVAGYALNPVRGVENVADSFNAVKSGLGMAGSVITGQPLPDSEPDARTVAPPPLTTETPQVPTPPVPAGGPLASPLTQAAEDLTNVLSP